MKSHSEQLDELQKLQQQIYREQELLKAQQEYLENAPLELKIALAHLEQAKADKQSVLSEIEEKRTDLKAIKFSVANYISKSEEEQAKADSKFSLKEQALGTVETAIAKATAELNKIKDESGTRKRYLAEQEGIITHIMEEANDSINEAHVKYSQLERSIGVMETQRITLKEDIDMLTLDKNTLEGEVVLIEEDNTAKIEEATLKLHAVEKTVADLRVDHDLIVQDIEARKQELRGEIESIDAKRAALFNENAELQTAKRRDTSAREVYGL